MDKNNFGYNLADPGYYQLFKEFAKRLKLTQTEAEKALWAHLCKKQQGVRFRRQYIIGEYIADFACLPKRLIIEVDGGYHLEEQKIKADAFRTNRLEAMGFKVIRFTNEDVLENIDDVLTIIKENIQNQKSYGE